jgi:DNA polymerase V
VGLAFAGRNGDGGRWPGWLSLTGHPEPSKQQIISSRAFGQQVFLLQNFNEAVTFYASRAAEKLWKQAHVAGAIQVYLETNRFKPDEPQYSNGVTVKLLKPTENTFSLAEAALYGLNRFTSPVMPTRRLELC